MSATERVPLEERGQSEERRSRFSSAARRSNDMSTYVFVALFVVPSNQTLNIRQQSTTSFADCSTANLTVLRSNQSSNNPPLHHSTTPSLHPPPPHIMLLPEHWLPRAAVRYDTASLAFLVISKKNLTLGYGFSILLPTDAEMHFPLQTSSYLKFLLIVTT
jgi:hypothetical protein